jgi:hypothetical protein
MITILNKIFPEDISKIIYNFVVQDYIQYVIKGKVYTNILIMEKHYNNFCTIVNVKGLLYDPSSSYTEIINVCKFLKYMKNHFIEKKYYNYDICTKEIIQNFKEIINYISKNENHNLIKNYFKDIYNEI